MFGKQRRQAERDRMAKIERRLRKLGFTNRLIKRWMKGDNLDLGCTPAKAIKEGRVEETIAVAEAFAEGRPYEPSPYRQNVEAGYRYLKSRPRLGISATPPRPPEPGPPEPPQPPTHRPVS